MNTRLRKLRGFTIVELVVVIILLGILAATALPRFIDVDNEAHDAAYTGVLGGFQTGVALYHAQWIAQGQVSAGAAIPEFNGLRMTAQGYPYSNTAQAGNVPLVSQDCEDVFVGLLQSAPTISDVVALANVTASPTDYTAVRNGANCEFYYTAQFNAATETVPFFTYFSATGAIAQSSAVLL